MNNPIPLQTIVIVAGDVVATLIPLRTVHQDPINIVGEEALHLMRALADPKIAISRFYQTVSMKMADLSKGTGTGTGSALI